MRKRARKIFWGCMTVFLLGAGMLFLTRLTDPGDADKKNAEFMKDSELYDVLFFGNSHMTYAVYPLELWNDHGIASYNLGSYGNPLPTTYWTVKNALNESNPKLVVVDCYSVEREEKEGSFTHWQTDHLPLRADKIRMINDVVEDPEERLEYFWRFAAYHSRWWDLDQDDFEKKRNEQKGAEIAYGVVLNEKIQPRPQNVVEMDSTGGRYLRQIIECCQEKKTEILLIYLPYSVHEDGWQDALYAERIAREYDVPYLNFLDLSVINPAIDCSDEASHLNGSGGRKVTEYLGQYIKEHYEIADRRGEEAYAQWNADYKRYTDDKIDALRESETLDRFLMTLADPAFSCCVYVDGDSRIWEYEQYVELVRNLAPEYAFEALEKAVGQQEDYFLIIDRKSGVVAEYSGKEEGELETSFGRLLYTEEQNGQKALYLGASRENLLGNAEEDAEDLTVRVFAIDNRDGAVAVGGGFEETFRAAVPVR